MRGGGGGSGGEDNGPTRDLRRRPGHDLIRRCEQLIYLLIQGPGPPIGE